MIWKNGLTTEEKRRLKSEWHRKFAWVPTIVGVTKDNHYVKAWLCFIEQKGEYWGGWTGGCWSFEYRSLDKSRGK
jgi:hypothetical protein